MIQITSVEYEKLIAHSKALKYIAENLVVMGHDEFDGADGPDNLQALMEFVDREKLMDAEIRPI